MVAPPSPKHHKTLRSQVSSGSKPALFDELPPKTFHRRVSAPPPSPPAKFQRKRAASIAIGGAPKRGRKQVSSAFVGDSDDDDENVPAKRPSASTPPEPAPSSALASSSELREIKQEDTRSFISSQQSLQLAINAALLSPEDKADTDWRPFDDAVLFHLAVEEKTMPLNKLYHACERWSRVLRTPLEYLERLKLAPLLASAVQLSDDRSKVDDALLNGVKALIIYDNTIYRAGLTSDLHSLSSTWTQFEDSILRSITSSTKILTEIGWEAAIKVLAKGCAGWSRSAGQCAARVEEMEGKWGQVRYESAGNSVVQASG
ncbi:ATPase of HSP90 chaperone topoisomerase II kinase [Pseudohyphozyma bogoriensis]|nr:ATPase of HSP90 chaperone topoisomerase II kinase [Pseudohyphozyma bogoriensis]